MMVNQEDQDDRRAYLPSPEEIEEAQRALRPMKEAKMLAARQSMARKNTRYGGTIVYRHHGWRGGPIFKIREE